MDTEITKCKICGEYHPVDSYRGMKFYMCPETKRVYLIVQEDKDGNPIMPMDTD